MKSIRSKVTVLLMTVVLVFASTGVAFADIQLTDSHFMGEDNRVVYQLPDDVTALIAAAVSGELGTLLRFNEQRGGFYDPDVVRRAQRDARIDYMRNNIPGVSDALGDMDFDLAQRLVEDHFDADPTNDQLMEDQARAAGESKLQEIFRPRGEFADITRPGEEVPSGEFKVIDIR